MPNRTRQKRRISQIFFDRKMDCRHIPTLYGRKHWVHLNIHDKGFKLALQPPPGVPLHVWINIVSSLIAVRGMLVASAICLVRMINFLVHAMNVGLSGSVLFPDFRLLLDVARAAPLSLWASKTDYGNTLIQLLEGVVASSSCFQCFRGLDINDIIAEGRSCVIEMPTTYPAWLRLFITDLIIAHILYGRIHRQETSDDTEVIIYLDEADQDLTLAASDSAFSDNYSVLAQLLRMGREFGISCVVGLGVLGHVSKFVSSSFRRTFVFSITEGEQKQLAARTLSLPPGAEQMLLALQPGHCILLASMSGWPHAMECKIDYLPPYRERVDISYDSCQFVPSRRLWELPAVQEALRRLKAERNSERLILSGGSETDAGKLPPRDLKLLQTAAAYPWWPFGKLEEKAQLTLSPQARIAIRRDLKDGGYAEFDRMRLGSSPVILMALTDKGWEAAVCKPPSHTGGGNIKHRHVANWVAMSEARGGLKAACEVDINGHRVDCAVTDAQGQIEAYEVVVDCETNLLQHLMSLSQASNVKSITIVCLEKQVQQRLQRELQAQMVVMTLGNRLRWELAETFYRRLWP